MIPSSSEDSDAPSPQSYAYSGSGKIITRSSVLRDTNNVPVDWVGFVEAALRVKHVPAVAHCDDIGNSVSWEKLVVAVRTSEPSKNVKRKAKSVSNDS